MKKKFFLDSVRFFIYSNIFVGFETSSVLFVVDENNKIGSETYTFSFNFGLSFSRYSSSSAFSAFGFFGNDQKSCDRDC
jgi:hypothetical protein